MKRILFVCCMLTATCVIPTQKAAAQTSVSVTTFNTKVGELDALIGAGSMTAAQVKWNEIHDMMKQELAATKQNIASSATPATSPYMTTMQTQIGLYREIWELKNDLSANRAALNTKLLAFSATF